MYNCFYTGLPVALLKGLKTNNSPLTRLRPQQSPGRNRLKAAEEAVASKTQVEEEVGATEGEGVGRDQITAAVVGPSTAKARTKTETIATVRNSRYKKVWFDPLTKVRCKSKLLHCVRNSLFSKRSNGAP